jgi:hypothetical protein
MSLAGLKRMVRVTVFVLRLIVIPVGSGQLNFPDKTVSRQHLEVEVPIDDVRTKSKCLLLRY